MPTLGISIDAQMIDFIRVIDEFGVSEDLKVEILESRLGAIDVIEYHKPLIAKKIKKQAKTVIRKVPKKGICERQSSDSDDSADW